MYFYQINEVMVMSMLNITGKLLFFINTISRKFG